MGEQIPYLGTSLSGLLTGQDQLDFILLPATHNGDSGGEPGFEGPGVGLDPNLPLSE